MATAELKGGRTETDSNPDSNSCRIKLGERFQKELVPPVIQNLVVDVESLFNPEKGDWKVDRVWAKGKYTESVNDPGEKQPIKEFIVEGVKPNSPDIVEFLFRLRVQKTTPILRGMFHRETGISIPRILNKNKSGLDWDQNRNNFSLYIIHNRNFRNFASNEGQAGYAGYLPPNRYGLYFVQAVEVAGRPQDIGLQHKDYPIEDTVIKPDLVYVRVSLQNIIALLKIREMEAKTRRESTQELYFGDPPFESDTPY